ncbi:hypothetical protein ACFQU2_10675 [Siccirubricoccus deserti]
MVLLRSSTVATQPGKLRLDQQRRKAAARQCDTEDLLHRRGRRRTHRHREDDAPLAVRAAGGEIADLGAAGLEDAHDLRRCRQAGRDVLGEGAGVHALHPVGRRYGDRQHAERFGDGMRGIKEAAVIPGEQGGVEGEAVHQRLGPEEFMVHHPGEGTGGGEHLGLVLDPRRAMRLPEGEAGKPGQCRNQAEYQHHQASA